MNKFKEGTAVQLNTTTECVTIPIGTLGSIDKVLEDGTYKVELVLKTKIILDESEIKKL